ncbi:3-hydroxyacyl-CoA dehydrogenase NAD-binding domain-containing protein [Labrenzia sp. CE80]|uniref:3-hydroxyacyl-CoA dehydrogenase family protein n=1 Tax=Labrenzia sp. CE80 TaxID=1788986 RepID=UPI00129B3128|nr:3-hydroxyacyl-CoA dehydrogenase NAD-binding domain-containing protein [Labrenzia sp. CE80]
MQKPLNITVVGAGLMGHGIAYVLAQAGHSVRVYDRAQEALASLPERLAKIADLFGAPHALIDTVSAHSELSEAAESSDFVVEAAAENLEIKQFIVASLEAVVSQQTIIASNTSALPITRIAEKAFNPERIVGSHFWNPPHLVKLVEVVQAEKTAPEAVEKTISLLSGVGHHAVHVKKDIPGFIGNRLQHALKREAIDLVSKGVCDAETVDDVVKHGFGKRLGVLGPLEQSDLVGLGLTKAIHKTLMPDLDRTNTVHPFLEEKVVLGHLGMACGEGFRTWTLEEAEAVRSRLNTFLVEQAKAAKTNDQ